MPETLTIDMKRPLGVDEILSVTAAGVQVALSPETRAALIRRRKDVEGFITGQKRPAYGFNRGFGHNVDLAVPADRLSQLQENLILSHAVGVGDPIEPGIVRITMLLRILSLSRGYSGVRPELIDHLIGFLNNDIIPLVPEYGSVGASGDLAPLSHIGLALLGKGRVLLRGEEMEAAKALILVGMVPLRLEMKEGLALNNGVQFMNAIGMLACRRLKTLLQSAVINTALVSQVMLAPDTYFRADFHALRPHPGAVRVADWIWRLMENSPIRESHRPFEVDGQVQDPYNIRCAAQVLGTCYELIDKAERTFLTEANSITDNPIVLPAGPDAPGVYQGKYVDVISGGHFHGMPIAVQIYNLFQGLGIMTNLAHQRSARFVDESKNKGLGRDLKWPESTPDELSVSSGMMVLEYTSAALTNDIWGALTPSHLFNISTNSGQEDHVSMGTSLAVRLLKTLPKAARVLAIELAYVCQAIAIRRILPVIPTYATLPPDISRELDRVRKKLQKSVKGVIFEVSVQGEHPLAEAERRLSPVSETLYQTISERQLFPTVTADRFLADDLMKLAHFIDSGEMVETVEKVVRLGWTNTARQTAATDDQII
jgi:histidine ammonia-lyase